MDSPVVTGSLAMLLPRCPRCGFVYAWDGRACGHCPTPARRRQLWEQTSRFTELVNSGKSITPRQRLAIVAACLRRVRHLLPEQARAQIDELDAGLDGGGRWGDLPAEPMPHTTDAEQEVTNAVMMVSEAVRGAGLEVWAVQQVAARCSRAVGFRTWPTRHLLSFPLPPELEGYRSAVADALVGPDARPSPQLLARDPADPVRAAYDELTRELQDYTRARWGATGDEEAAQCGIARDVLGDPEATFRFDPNWLTSDVVALARGVYQERAFDRMPYLADALQEADCEEAEILDHLRDPNAAHVRGCWALDLVLGVR